ncbi:efflux RND transporter periplasmic adaptor subunit [Neisseria sp. Ec49-e6-T10]|uniref:efflux RND transporter periplasmic adaptor subunit n=1 Tax=Neisseria sp. Ec49-e6-T10 TaxID=3140744 RepID=UPI003EB9B3C5
MNQKIEQVLNINGQHNKKKRKWYLAIIILIICVVGVLLVFNMNKQEKISYLTEAVKKGNISLTVSATGTVQPTNTVDISSELSGTVDKVLVDYNDEVKKGQVLAILDTQKLNDELAQSKANLQAAKARVVQSQADVEQAKIDYGRLQQIAQLSGGVEPAKSELDQARIKLKNAQAALDASRASAAQSEASLKAQQTDLTKAKIISPIDGVVLSRSIEPGQTVASSFQAPVLFVIAEDLTQMEINVAIAEADVGQIEQKQKAKFTVDAYPDKTYEATVKQVRYQAKTVDNVVSYETILDAKNNDLTLRPGMTAAADILVTEKNNILIIPTSALRFTPLSKEMKEKLGGGPISFGRPTRDTDKEVTTTGHTIGKEQQIWVLRHNQAVPVQIKTGINDGRHVEVLEGDIKEHDQVIIATQSQSKGNRQESVEL